MNPQNMKQALERLDEIKERAKDAIDITTLLERRDRNGKKEVVVRIYNADGKYPQDSNGRYCAIHADLLHEAALKTQERLEKEKAMLQPIIDMAEAALRGVFSNQ